MEPVSDLTDKFNREDIATILLGLYAQIETWEHELPTLAANEASEIGNDMAYLQALQVSILRDLIGDRGSHVGYSDGAFALFVAALDALLSWPERRLGEIGRLKAANLRERINLLRFVGS